MPLQAPESYAQGQETIKRRRSGELSALVVAEALKHDRMSWNDFAIKHNLSASTVYTIVKKMKKEGRIPKERLHKQKSTLTADGKPIWEARQGQKAAPPADLSALIETLGHTSALNPDTRRQILAVIATQSTDTNKISAITKLEELDRQAGSRIGPPPPETDDEYAERLGRIIRRAGPKMTQLAINWVATHPEEALAAPTQGDLGPNRPGNGPTSGLGPQAGPPSPPSGQAPDPNSGPTPLPAPEVPPSGGLDGPADSN